MSVNRRYRGLLESGSVAQMRGEQMRAESLSAQSRAEQIGLNGLAAQARYEQMEFDNQVMQASSERSREHYRQARK